MGMGTHVALIPETASGCDLQSRRAQSLPDLWEIRGVFRAGCGDEGQGDGIGEYALGE
jgi:hypothetical protein